MIMNGKSSKEKPVKRRRIVKQTKATTAADILARSLKPPQPKAINVEPFVIIFLRGITPSTVIATSRHQCWRHGGCGETTRLL
jgi:hypothetical protein